MRPPPAVPRPGTAGTAMVTLADGQYRDDPAAAKQSVAGDMLCLLSAVVYGAYTVSIRWVAGRLAAGREREQTS